MRNTNQNKLKYIIRRHCSALHVILLLPGLYTFNTVCYRVGQGDFSVKGKLTALKLTKKYAKFRELIKTTGWKLSDKLLTGLYEFACFMYHSNPSISDVSSYKLRYLPSTSTSYHHASTLYASTAKGLLYISSVNVASKSPELSANSLAKLNLNETSGQ